MYYGSFGELGLQLFGLVVRPGSVRNIIQQFESHSETVEDGESEGQRLSSSSFGEDSMERFVLFAITQRIY